MTALDTFFNLGNKVTKGDPVRKAQFDYYLFWIVFLSFASIAILDFYSFFFNDGPLNSLFWGIVVCIFCWFNYAALGSFRGVYMNMKALKQNNPQETKFYENVESKEEMMKAFS